MLSSAKANFYQLNLNYLLNTAYKSLIDKKAKYDPTDPAFLSAIISGYNLLDFKMNQHFMFKTYFIYLFNLLKRYMVKKEEEILHEICVCVMEPTSQRSVPLDLIDKLRLIICKKAAHMNLNNLATDKYKIDFIDVGEKLATYTDEAIERTDLESYDDEAFWEEICQLIKNEQIFTFSLLSKIANNPDIDLVENEEKEIELSKLFRKRKAMYDSSDHENDENKTNKKPKKTTGPSPKKKTPLTENNEIINGDPEIIDEEMILGQSPVRSVDIDINKSVSRRTPVRVSRDKLIETGLETAEDSESSSDTDTAVTSNSARSRKQSKPKRKLKAAQDSSQCSEDGSILKTTMYAEEEDLYVESSSEASISETEEEEDQTKMVSFREEDTSGKKKVPINRFDGRSDSKYLDSEYSDEEGDELDFNESFSTRNKNALKDNLKKVKRKSSLRQSSTTESESVGVSSSRVTRSRSKSSGLSPHDARNTPTTSKNAERREARSRSKSSCRSPKLTRRQSTRNSAKNKNEKVSETRQRSKSNDKSPKLERSNSGRNCNKYANENVRQTRSRSRSTGTTPKSPRRQSTKIYNEEIEDVRLDDNDRSNKSPMNMSQSIKTTGRKFWTEAESAYLVLGVKLYGKGNWSMIQSNFANKLKDRTQVQLKDRYRTLQNRVGELTKIEKIADEFYKTYNEQD